MRYEVDSVEVTQTAVRMRATIAAVEAEVSSMMGQLTALQSSWSGAASSAFAALAQEWKATQTQVETNLTNITEALDQVASEYASVEDLAVQTFSGS
ncbi:WXG100 family type VII secretion target [Buchananella hordeovulneris]|uniref:ESAT-6-like protein n=1 Tax=Buchananella hordeovulneris TaxID=52770 RepID=A0A1Q5PVH2_9ACTO|nr:WXG100 family type VII secretion target [Buchananella hordeovulneris]MDO5080469.1 WXG100 family type VII secretion target [Buchananella hordeovulneris]OKL51435.1 hypothetical protein BSZ40_07670 [Buchananella hordeovulneris]RRD44304.1 WXG100 family type VII secretion target [Buchananella hordeovulneris]RRD51787.1 WXG100 family type VII secretion target [Buchananella hordeovulneris]